MTGGKSKFVDMDEIKMMEKEIDGNNKQAMNKKYLPSFFFSKI